MLNHVANVQSVHGDPYPRSLHDSTPNGKWLSPGTPAYARLVALASERLLLKDIEKLSASIQTYNPESFHGVLIKFAPKSVSFSTDILAILHHIENTGRAQAVTKDGKQKWKRKQLRARKGEVVCPVKTATTYGYVPALVQEVDRCISWPSFRQARNESSRSSSQSRSMSELCTPRHTKQELIPARQ
ncbi:uncharacterized protein LOC144121590 [Amblyomma americanum]